MSKIIIGIDPDAVKNGIAVFEEGKLVLCESMTIMQFIEFCNSNEHNDVQLHIEDVNGNRCSSFNWRPQDSKYVKAKKSESVGKCKHAQMVIEEIAYHFGFEVVKHRVSSKWKSQAQKKEFELVTGWTGRSNEDSRSAAYMAWQGLKC